MFFLIFLDFQSFQELVKIVFPNLKDMHSMELIILDLLLIKKLLEFFHFLLSE